MKKQEQPKDSLFEAIAKPANLDEVKQTHTPVPWFVNLSGHPDNGRIQIGSSKDFICEIYGKPDDEATDEVNELQSQANAARIVECVNGWDMLNWDLRRVERDNEYLRKKNKILSGFIEEMKLTLKKAHDTLHEISNYYQRDKEGFLKPNAKGWDADLDIEIENILKLLK